MKHRIDGFGKLGTAGPVDVAGGVYPGLCDAVEANVIDTGSQSAIFLGNKQ